MFSFTTNVRYTIMRLTTPKKNRNKYCRVRAKN